MGISLCIPSAEQELQAHPLNLEGVHRSGWRTQWNELRNAPYRGYNQGVLIDSPSKCPASIALLDPANPGAVAKLAFETPSWLDRPSAGDYLLEPPERFSPFNRFHRSTGNNTCRVVPLGEVGNHIFWRPTSRSMQLNTILDSPDSIGLHRLQIDSSFPQETMAGSGRYLSFQVLNPSPKVRLLVSGTTSRLPGDQNLPPAAVVGEQRVSLPFTGQGAARVISEPLSVQHVGGSKFLVLDLGRTPPAFDPANSSLGSETRPISMFIRDVSLLSEQDYAALAPPECVKSFPLDLGNKQLEFSGCGEDGSVGKQSWFRLLQTQNAGSVVVRGTIPTTNSNSSGQNELQLKINGVEVGQKSVVASQFEFRIFLPPEAGVHKLELHFSNSRSISPTSRPVSAVLSFVGFEQ
jgi:hypothetical protein